jgi:ribose transport system substrate-binding protein
MVERHEGLLEAVEDAGVTEATFLPDNLSREAAQANLRIALAEHPDVDALVGLSSSTGPAAADILVEMGRDDIHVVAMDATAPTQEYLATGLIDVMVAQRPYYWGYLGLYIMYAMRTLGDDATRTLLEPWLSGEDMDILDTGTDVVRPADLEFYLEYLESIGISAS